MALVDVRSGNRAMLRAEPLEEQALSTRYAREHLDSGFSHRFEEKKLPGSREPIDKSLRRVAAALIRKNFSATIPIHKCAEACRTRFLLAPLRIICGLWR
jgi:hypothetical protein